MTYKFDHQNVKLVGITQPTISECSNAQELIAYIARVSNPSNQASHETAERLLKYCIKHSHWSVFETVNAVLEIETTRDIGRQLLRHRSFTFQEFSQRYADPTKDLNFVLRECRLQDQKNRQNSVVTDDLQKMAFWEQYQQRVIAQCNEAYEWAIANGIAKEQARAVLPEGNTMSRMYVNGTLRSWIHYCSLRRANGTQLEHIDLANKCWSVICDSFPTLKGL